MLINIALATLAAAIVVGPSLYLARHQIKSDLKKLCHMVLTGNLGIRIRLWYAVCSVVLLLLTHERSVYDPVAWLYLAGSIAGACAVVWPYSREFKRTLR